MNQEWYPIHHSRSRFKGEEEDIVYYMANSINEKPTETKKFKSDYDDAMKYHPKNAGKKPKTISNWRTEMTSLFALTIEENGKVSRSPLSEKLVETGDIIQYFRSFLFNFQYPGGHLKEKENKRLIDFGIKFKPAHYILKLLIYGSNGTKGKKFGVTKEEIAFLVFNNLAVTRDHISEKNIYEIIMKNRAEGHIYDPKYYPSSYETSQDEFRYARDILDYLEKADLVTKRLDDKYYPKMQNIVVINEFLNDKKYFEGYDSFYGKRDFLLKEIKDCKTEWQKYASRPFKVNYKDALYPDLPVPEEEDEQNLVTISAVQTPNEIISLINKIENTDVKTKVTGNIGETISIIHEQNKLKKIGRPDLSKQVQKIPDHLGVGYDILSFDAQPENETNIQIEVKTTRSRNTLKYKMVQLTHSEYRAAKTHKENYFIYRLSISKDNIDLFIIQDPYQKEKSDLIETDTTSSGVVMVFKEPAGKFEEILL